MEKLIFDYKDYSLIVLDSGYKVIPNLISKPYIIKNIDFNNLPSNIFNNVSLYLGKQYQLFEIDLKKVSNEVNKLKGEDIISLSSYLFSKYFFENKI